jgi:uncharacterized membrane protein
MTETSRVPLLIDSDSSDYRDAGITSTVAVAGHPLHPLLVTFPIAFLVSALARASLWLLGAGFICGILAALSGMIDFLRIDRVRKRSAGWAHMLGNIAALLIAAVNWILRFDNPVNAILPRGITLSVLVSLLLGVTGWYGGELAYRHKVGVIGDSSRHED